MARERILITVKTYPTLSRKYGETVCTAGVREDGAGVSLSRAQPVGDYRRSPHPARAPTSTALTTRITDIHSEDRLVQRNFAPHPEPRHATPWAEIQIPVPKHGIHFRSSRSISRR